MPRRTNHDMEDALRAQARLPHPPPGKKPGAPQRACRSVICYSQKIMTIFKKVMTCCLLAAVLGFASFPVAAILEAQQVTAPAKPGPSAAAANADFAAAADEVLQQMSEITGLKLRTPLKKSLRSREQIRAYVINEMNEDKDVAERYAGQRSAEAFGLLPKG